jgi:putative hydrolase of the HAD superfamily
MIRALLLDADGVMQYPKPGWVNAFTELGDGPEFAKELFVAERPAVAGQADLHDQVAEVIARHRLSITPEQIIEVWCRIDVDPLMLKLVKRIREAGVHTVLATNQHSYRGRWMQANLPYDDYFDRQFYSFELGVAKPDPAYFTTVLESIAVAPEEAVFVDDLGSNVRGARGVGLNAAVFAATDTYGALRLKLRAFGVPGI